MSQDSDVQTSENVIKIVNVSDYEQSKIVENDKVIFKVYRRRWLMISLFIIYSTLASTQSSEYSIITNIISRYYNVSTFAVDCTSMVFMISYGILIFPVTYLIERVGLRWTLIIGSALCCLGTWIKIFSLPPDRFLVTLLGQSIIAISMVMIVPVPGRIAAKWFPSKELSIATGLGILGNQLGFLISSLTTPIIVKNHENVEHIGDDLSFIFWCYAIATTVNLMIIVLLFQEEPKFPPSKTRALQKFNQSLKNENLSITLKKLFTNQSFLILCNSFGMLMGIFNSILTLLNQLYLIHFKNGEEDVGRIGLLVMVTGLFGSIFFGIILDKTHKFKETAIITYFLTLCGQIFFSVALVREIKWMIYVTAIFLGFFILGYLTIGYEMATEFTFPESEVHSAGILNITNNIYGIVFILILEQVLERYGDLPVLVITCLILLAGLIMTIMTKDEQRRQDVRKSTTLHKDAPLENVDKNI